MTTQPPDVNSPHGSLSQSNEQGHNFNIDGQGNYVATGDIHITYTKPTDQLATQPSDFYHIYLRKLLTRINEYLTKKLLSTFQDSAEGIEPLPISSQRLNKTVDARYEKQNEIDPLFVVGGIADELPRSYSSFHSAFEHYEGRVLLLGEPGAGKTVTLLHFARDMVLKRLQDSSFPSSYSRDYSHMESRSTSIGLGCKCLWQP